jgi:hypothetical protein
MWGGTCPVAVDRVRRKAAMTVTAANEAPPGFERNPE